MFHAQLPNGSEGMRLIFDELGMLDTRRTPQNDGWTCTCVGVLFSNGQPGLRHQIVHRALDQSTRAPKSSTTLTVRITVPTSSASCASPQSLRMKRWSQAKIAACAFHLWQEHDTHSVFFQNDGPALQLLLGKSSIPCSRMVLKFQVSILPVAVNSTSQLKSFVFHA